MAPKQRTKGQKEIDRDNIGTVSFWDYVMATATVAHLLLLAVYWHFDTITIGCYVVFTLSTALHLLSAWMLRKIAGSGLDLTINDGTAGYIKDVAIVTIGAQSLSILISSYFFLLWLIVPFYAVYKLFATFLWPWFTMGSEQEPMSDKERKKKERKMAKRMRVS